jgi:hypothetical protein
MPRKPTNPQLAIVPPSAADPTAPPPGLDATGLKLWREVVASYEFSDAASLTILEQAARALDRAARCAAEIAKDGEMIRVRNGTLRANPLLRDELGFRAFAVRALGKLGLDLEPIRPGVGRPGGGGVGFTVEQLRGIR